MRAYGALLLVVGFLIPGMPLFAADGTFQGKVVEAPGGQAPVPGWIFVQSRNRMLRRVEVSHATIVFGDEVPASQRHKCNSDCLGAGQEVRITAAQDASGEWRAKRIEIIHLPSQVARAPRKDPALPIFTPKLWIRRITIPSNNASHRIRVKST